MNHVLEGPTLANIEKTAAVSSASVGEVVLAAWQSLLSRLARQPRFTIGVTFEGREYEELSDAVGLLAKTLPIPVQFEKDFQFLEILGRTRDALAEAVGWQEYFDPGTTLGTEPSVAFHSTVLLGWDRAGEIEFRTLQEQVSAQPGKLRLCCGQSESRLRLEFHYDASRFAREDIQQLAQQLEVLLEAAVANPQTAVSRLPLMSEVERERIVVEWNKTEAAYPAQCIHKLFEQQVARVPDRTAVRCEDQSLSYCELNEQSNRLAHALRKLGVGPDSLVALLLGRSVEMMVAVLAIVKAGGAYVPLNTDNPKARLQQQLDGVAVLLTQQDLLAKIPEFGGKTLCPDSEQSKWSSESRENPEPTATPENLAYVIYTSGSTGVPKGVAVRHRNLVNYAWFVAKELKLWDDTEGLQFASVSTLASDLGNTCIYPALISGGCLHLLPYEVATDAHRIALYQDRYPIDVLKIVPSHLAALLDSARPEKILPRKYLITGGETLTRKLVSKIGSSAATCQIINHYGPTETTVGSLIRPLSGYESQKGAANIPIGRPIANTRVYVLDEQLQPVPVGMTGELYIAGEGVTAGYLGQPERTEERFLVDPFAGKAEARMYRTGDVARYLEDGNVEFLGRVDDQVKVRGFRIELGEIESALLRQPGVKQAVVLAREDEEHEKQLVGYVVADREENVTAEQLQKVLKEQLPEYMVPVLVLLEKLPLTSNGKVDRMALPKPEEFAAQEKVYFAPGTPTEQILARMWMELLRCPRVSLDDNFFELGGHSLTATQVISRVRAQFAVEIAVRALFETPTLAGLAAAIDLAKARGTLTDGPITRASREVYIEAKSGT
jgi:amino acid adenylation domain-containing protein